MKEMVLGFLFSEQKGVVALILKDRPEWQKGFLNGIGGHIEEGETPLQAMVREFEEETGLLIEDWERFAIMQGDDWKVYCFKAFSDKVWDAKSETDETVVRVYLHQTPKGLISNVPWLIEMALDNHDNFIAIINYNKEDQQ